MESTLTPSDDTIDTTEKIYAPGTPDAPPTEVRPGWETLGLSEEALAVIRQAGFEKPTPIQAKAIPVALEGRDIIASAQTGTGKTASFLLPMAERFAGREGTFGLVLAPTREIAQQIQQTAELLCTPRKIRAITLIGGIDLRYDLQAIQTYPQIIVATPGRLCDHLDRGNLWLDYLEFVVLDEADRMLDMGFAAQLSRIMSEVPQNRQTLLFSATIPPSVDSLAKRILHDPARVAIGAPQSTADKVEQRLLWMRPEYKMNELMKLLQEEKGSIIVFTRSKDEATRLWRSLHSRSVYDATYLHSDRTQAHREQALAEFKSGKYRVLIATDVAARGLHIEGVAHVLNYDLPLEPESYVHRIGRTGRAGASGKSTTFVTLHDRKLLRDIESLIKKEIPAEFTPSFRPEDLMTKGPQKLHPTPHSKGGRGGHPPRKGSGTQSATHSTTPGGSGKRRPRRRGKSKPHPTGGTGQ